MRMRPGGLDTTDASFGAISIPDDQGRLLGTFRVSFTMICVPGRGTKPANNPGTLTGIMCRNSYMYRKQGRHRRRPSRRLPGGQTGHRGRGVGAVQEFKLQRPRPRERRSASPSADSRQHVWTLIIDGSVEDTHQVAACASCNLRYATLMPKQSRTSGRLYERRGPRQREITERRQKSHQST